ncbi:MAG TPA: DUF4389 domain-containing protein [Polyangiales bacterium]
METAAARGAGGYPVTLEIQHPLRFERVQVLLRLLVCLAMGALHQSLAGLFATLYFFMPVVVAVLVSRRGGARFLTGDSTWLCTCLEWVIGVYAYLLFVTDRFPLGVQERPVRLHVHLCGTPSVGGALLRLVTSIPHALVLCLLSVVSALLGLVAALAILASEHYPSSLRTFQHNLVAWLARLFAYHASLVDVYPPFAFTEHATTPPASLPGDFGVHGSTP